VPKLGRFTAPDPAGMVDGPNLYAYAGSDPVNNWDPSGLVVRINGEDYNPRVHGGYLFEDKQMLLEYYHGLKEVYDFPDWISLSEFLGAHEDPIAFIKNHDRRVTVAENQAEMGRLNRLLVIEADYNSSCNIKWLRMQILKCCSDDYCNMRENQNLVIEYQDAIRSGRAPNAVFGGWMAQRQSYDELEGEVQTYYGNRQAYEKMMLDRARRINSTSGPWLGTIYNTTAELNPVNHALIAAMGNNLEGHYLSREERAAHGLSAIALGSIQWQAYRSMYPIAVKPHGFVEISGGQTAVNVPLTATTGGGTVTSAGTGGPTAYGTPYRQLSRSRIQHLEAKVTDRTITRSEWKHLEWQRRLTLRRQSGIDAFWAEERERLSLGLAGTRNWNDAAREAILGGGQPSGIFSHHRYSVSQYPQLANDPSNVMPLTFREHFQKWHGRNWRNATHGVPLRPEVLDDF
jgi:hypothetical protein